MNNNNDYIIPNSDDLSKDILALLLNTDVKYFVIKTKYTTNHIEKLMVSCKDRGCIKWIAETNLAAYDNGIIEKDAEAYRSHIDGADLFPRLYFNPQAFCIEFRAWFEIRKLTHEETCLP